MTTGHQAGIEFHDCPTCGMTHVGPAQVPGAPVRATQSALVLVRELDSVSAELSRAKAILRRVQGLLTDLGRVYPELCDVSKVIGALRDMPK